MDHFLKRDLKTASLIFAILLVSACSSSTVDSSADAPETAASTEMMSDEPQATDGLASTDAVPPEANTDSVPQAPVADAPPVEAPPAESPLAETTPPPADLASAPSEAVTPPPAPDVSTTNPEPMAPPAETASVSENPSLAQEPAPTSLAASTNPPPAPAEEPSMGFSTQSQVSGEVTQYKVKRGDTLMKIAFENYGDLFRWKDILDGNQNVVKDPNQINPGTVLMLSGAGMVTIERNGEKYLIKVGDTLGLISNEVYGTNAKWKKLWENNRQLIKNPNRIFAGFNLYYVPEARMTQDQSLPFKGTSEPAQVATGPGEADAVRMPNSEK